MHFQLRPVLAYVAIDHESGYDQDHALLVIFFAPPLNCLLPLLADFYTIEFFQFSNEAYPIVDANRHNICYAYNNSY